jgi:hypothetical protein
MHPPRRLEAELDPEHQDHDDGAQTQDDEHRRPVTGIVATQVQTAFGAALDHAQKAAEQPAAAAARAGPAQGDVDGRLPRPFGHHVLPKANRRGSPGGVF